MSQEAEPIAGDDLSALAWVQGELRRTLDAAHKALRRYVREAEGVGSSDVDSADPAVLRNARVQLHQGVGALELVGLPVVAQVLRGSEAALQRMVARPKLATPKAVEAIEQASFAVLDYLGRVLAGKPVSTLALFPQYAAVLAVAGAERVHPADLWACDWQWRQLPVDSRVTARPADDVARGEMEGLVLALMRETDPAAPLRMSHLCAELGAGAQGELATLWHLAAAFFEAQAARLIKSDVYTKRIASRLLAQLRAAIKGDLAVPARLAQDLLFYCVRAEATDPSNQLRLAAVQSVWPGDQQARADYETPRLGLVDPAVMQQARKRVSGAKDAWSAVAEGEVQRLAGLGESFALLADSLQRLFPGGDALAQALQAASGRCVQAQRAPEPELAMEVATAVLYLDAVLEDGELDQPQLAERIQRLAARIGDVDAGNEPQPLESWMEELYRRISDRQTMGSVVQELRSSLSDVEKQIDQYFRNPAQRELLIPVPAQLSAMRGVLTVLGMDQASQAVLHMRDSVDALAQTEVDPERAVQAGTFDRLADNLGALSFLIDMLSVQPKLAKTLFRFDAEAGVLSAVMGQSERVSTFAAFEPTALEPAVAPTQPAPLPEPAPTIPASAPVAAPAPVPAQPSGLEDDAEMREIFLEEAREVIAGARASLAALAQSADDVAEMTTVRRAFHTLKGSARMVGLKAFGEAAWGCEQLYNTRLAQNARMDAPLATLSDQALDYLADWTEAIAAGTDAGHEPSAVTAAADALRQEGRLLPIVPVGAQPADSAVDISDMDGDAPPSAVEQTAVLSADLLAPPSVQDLAARVPDLPAAADLDLMALDLPGIADVPAEAAAFADLSEVPATTGDIQDGLATEPLPDFTLDLQTLDEDAAGATSTALPDLPVAPDPEPAQAPQVVEEVELSEADFDLVFDTLSPAQPLPVDAIAPDLPESVPADIAFPSADETAAMDDVPVPAALEATAAAVETILPLDPATESSAVLADTDAVEAPAEAAQDVEFDVEFNVDLPVPPEPAIGTPVASMAIDEVIAPGVPAEIDTILAPDEQVADLAPTPLPLTDLPAVEAVPAADLELADAGPATAEASGAAMADAAPPSELAIDVPVLPPNSPVDGPSTSDALAEAPLADAGPVDDGQPDDGMPDDEVKIVGDLRIPIPLFNIFLNEADEQSRRLGTEIAEWALEPHRAVGESTIALAHSLAGNSATVGFADLSVLARALEHALMRSRAIGHASDGEPALFGDVAEEIRGLLHQFAAGFLRPVSEPLMARLLDHEVATSNPERDTESPSLDDDELTLAGALPPALPHRDAAEIDWADEVDAQDAIDPDLFPIFEEEADELLPQLRARLSEWVRHPGDASAASACMRTLHTFKGGARLAGAMRVGELAHRLETEIERLAGSEGVDAAAVERLLSRADAMATVFERLRAPAAAPTPAAEAPVPESLLAAPTATPDDAGTALSEIEATLPLPAPMPTADVELPLAPVDQPAPMVAAPVVAPAAIDWSRFADASLTEAPVPEAADATTASAGGATVRVRAPLLDRLVNQAGEVSITRARIESEMRTLQGSLEDLTDNLEKLRRHLRDIELQAETQISSRMEAAKAAAVSFDPLEMDRFTRFQELTRMMAESVNDVATVQRGLQRTLQASEDELAMQARLTRELQGDLLRTRMVEFESLADRLYRVVRLAAKDTGKTVRLDIVGGSIEVDRGVLERMVGPFEHLLRNSVAHGIEAAADRRAAGKPEGGIITITTVQEGNEVAVEVRDDGAGLDLTRIRARAVERGLLAADATPSDGEIAQLIFVPGFTTADTVTGLSGRGVGMDVVRAEVLAMGGRIETETRPGQGTAFRLLLPLTTAVTQVVMLRFGERQVAVPSTLVEVVRREKPAVVDASYASGRFSHDGEEVPFYWLGALLQAEGRGVGGTRSQTVVVLRSAAQRVAVHVDEVVGNQEVVVKNVGPQLSRLPGLAGVTLLPSGAVATIYNPVALAAVYGDDARQRMQAQPELEAALPAQPLPAVALSPLVMVVDDSLTVRRVTQRLLVREGYRVVLAKDGMDALERLAEERPAILLSDIEMPRMDGFDLVRNVRADPRLAGLPVIMITSRIAQKHRDYAAELGVDHYLGKPYAEDELLALVARHVQADIAL
ncbi:MAG: Hpt domain-containing protein [Burkholderiaceae bacterium]|nr:Hpt domain-containing protein [Burkholderiaceae bacterium]